MFSILKKNKRGQALVEYVLLLFVGVLSAFFLMQMEDTMKSKIFQVAEDLIYDNPGVPDVPIDITVPDLKLSPPVAQFTVPSPNYKGRDIHLVDSSYDPDGVIDYYIWNVDGQEVIKSRAENDAEKGLVISLNNELKRFRYTGTYTVTLIVIDNDGLVSNMVTKSIVVIDRAPTLDLSVTNHLGTTSNSSVSVWQYCPATFNTTYDDEDLPYEELTLYSKFTDHAGISTEYNTAPNQFTRTFMNKGTNTYNVRVTDEDFMSVSKTVSVNVISNPTLDAMGFDYAKGDPMSIPESTRCNSVPPAPEKCEISLSVGTGYNRFDSKTNTYYFEAGKTANVTATIKKGTNELHSNPYFFTSTDKKNTSLWDNVNKRTYPNGKKFELGDSVITVKAMGRDITSTSTNPDPSVQGNCKAYAEVKLAVECTTAACKKKPQAVISLNSLNWTKVPTVNTSGIVELNVSANNFTPTLCKSGECTVNVQSKYSNDDEDGGEVVGIKFKLPNDTQWRPTSTDYSNGTFSNIVKIKKSNGVVDYYISGKPDFASKLKLVYGDGPQGGGSEWWFYLKVIDNNGLESDPQRMIIKLNKNNEKPSAKCNVKGSPFNTGAVINTNFSAANSTDAENNIVKVEWSQNKDSGYVSGTTSNYKTSNPPKSWTYTKAGSYAIYVKVTDDAGQTDTATCSFAIKDTVKTVGPLSPEFLAWGNRVTYASEDIKVKNQTTKAEDVATDGIYWKYNTSIAKDASNEMPSRTVHGTKSSYDTLSTGGKVASFTAAIYVTDINGKPSCSGNSSLMSKPISGDDRNFCRKTTTYFRMGAFKILQRGVSGKMSVCTYYTINSNFTLIKDYVNRYSVDMSEKDGDITMVDRVQSFLDLKNCVIQDDSMD